MQKIFFTLLVLFSFSILIDGCIITQLPKTGEMLFQEHEYAEAAKLLMEELVGEEEVSVKARKTFLIGECFYNMFDPIAAEKWYKQAIDLNYDAIAIYKYAEMLKCNEKYEDAVKEFNNYLSTNGYDEDAKKELEACSLAVGWKKNPTAFEIKNIGSINSESFDFSPVPYDKGSIVFTSDRHDATGMKTFGWTGQKFTDLYISYNDGKGSYGAPVSFNNVINSPYNEASATFSKDFTECYFARSGTDNDDYQTCKIYYTYKMENQEWSEPQDIRLFTDSANVTQPFLSADGKQLYVSSDAVGGYGSKDLYVLNRTTDGWSEPENLGPAVNTSGKEGFPTIGTDGKLYFSSDGHRGMGGLDIFSATQVGKKWGNVQNLKYPINSGSDDFGIIFYPVKDEDKLSVKLNGLYTSNRPGGKGNDDIYSFVLKKTHAYVLNGVVEKKLYDDPKNQNGTFHQEPLAKADVMIMTTDGSTPIQHLKTDHDGKFSLMISAEKNFNISVSKTNLLSADATSNSIGFSKIDKDTVSAFASIILDSIYTNVAVNITALGFRNIYYDVNKANIRPDAARTLDSIVNWLNKNPSLKLELGSHTDSRGTTADNMKLSQRRADSAVNYLVRHGIDKSRLTAKGYGESMPVNKCTDTDPKCSDIEYQANRRTTFKFPDMEN